MHIICDGMQRSGSTWSFNIVRGLLAHCFPGEEVYSGYEEDIAGFMASVPQAAKHVVLKSHLLDPVGKALARSGMARIIYTWRSLPDAAASFLSMFGGDFEHVFLVITNSLVVYRFHLRNKNALMVGFDEMMQAPQETIGRIASYLSLNPSHPYINDLARSQSLEEVRKRLAQIEAMPDDTRLVRQGKSVAHDPETGLHRRHIQNGGSGYGAQTLTAEQLARLEALRQEYGFF